MSRIYSTNASVAVVMEIFHFKITAPYAVKCVGRNFYFPLLTLPHSLTHLICFNLPLEKWPLRNGHLKFTGGHRSRNSIEKINLLSAFCSLRALNTELNK